MIGMSKIDFSVQLFFYGFVPGELFVVICGNPLRFYPDRAIAGK
jgi:hypothetical protein